METAKTPSEKPNSESDLGSGLDRMKFNSTVSEETTVQVLKPQRDPGATKRVMVAIAVVVCALAVLGMLSFQRSGLSIGEVFNGKSDSSFGGPGEHPVDR